MFIQTVLPLEQERRNPLAFVRLGIGPPGCGKTVVAVEVARSAQFLDYDVLVLVPSSKLLRTYRDALVPECRVEETPFARAPNDESPRVWVERFSDFFKAFHQGDIPPLERWWAAVLENPAFQKWKVRYPCVATRRFLDYLDATLFDDEVQTTGRKDALATQDEPLRAAVNVLNSGQRKKLETERKQQGIVFKWEVARNAGPALAAARPGRDLLILVDEAQDLVPGQWQVLVQAAFERLTSRGWKTGVALLGDENQRIAPTSFAWTDVKAYVAGLHPDLETGVGTDTTELPGSFRVPSAVAWLANPLVDGSMDETSCRRAPVVHPERLREVGSVDICVCGDPKAELLRAADAIADRLHASVQRLIVLSEFPFPTHPLIDALDVGEAKGLEWDATVVADLFKETPDFDGRTRAYTRLSRTRRKLVLLLDEADWSTMKTFWETLTDGIQRVPPQRLEEVLGECLDATEEQDQAREYLARVDNLLEGPASAGAAFPEAALDLVVRSVMTGGGQDVPRVFEDYLTARPDWATWLESGAGSAPPERQAAARLALGDVGAALLIAENGRAQADLVAALRELLDMGGTLQAASYALRSQDGALDPLPNLARRAFLQRVREEVQSRELSDPPSWNKGTLPARRLEKETTAAIQGARKLLEKETKSARNDARDRIQKALGEGEQELSASPQVDQLRKIHARFEDLKTRFPPQRRDDE